jgi:hypothetical protein
VRCERLCAPPARAPRSHLPCLPLPSWALSAAMLLGARAASICQRGCRTARGCVGAPCGGDARPPAAEPLSLAPAPHTPQAHAHGHHRGFRDRSRKPGRLPHWLVLLCWCRGRLGHCHPRLVRSFRGHHRRCAARSSPPPQPPADLLPPNPGAGGGGVLQFTRRNVCMAPPARPGPERRRPPPPPAHPAVVAYAVTAGIPIILIALAGSTITRHLPHVFSLSDYIGWWVRRRHDPTNDPTNPPVRGLPGTPLPPLPPCRPAAHHMFAHPHRTI